MPSTSARVVGVAIDCADLEPLVRFYSALLGLEVTAVDPPDWAQLGEPAGGIHLNLQAVAAYEPPVWPDRPGAQAKMLHLEVEVADLASAVTTALEAGGSQAPWQPPDRDPSRLRVVLDPAGHPLCLFVTGE